MYQELHAPGTGKGLYLWGKDEKTGLQWDRIDR